MIHKTITELDNEEYERDMGLTGVTYSELYTEQETKLIREEQIKMANLRDTAMAYEPPQTLNIADLDVVSVDVEVEEKEGKTSEGETFKYFYTIVDGKEYRIPKTVLDELKTILSLKADLKTVNVTKSGSGLATRYKVNPLK